MPTLHKLYKITASINNDRTLFRNVMVLWPHDIITVGLVAFFFVPHPTPSNVLIRNALYTFYIHTL